MTAEMQQALQGQTQNRVLQSPDAGQGRTSVSGDQAPVWLCESALSWADEKHCSTDHAVCAVEPLDGSKTADEYRRVTRVTPGAGLQSPTYQCGRRFLHQATLKVVFVSTNNTLAES